MGRAIRSTCSYCQRDSYFSAAVGIPLEAISTSICTRCGRSGAVITLDIVPPSDVTVLSGLPRDRHSR